MALSSKQQVWLEEYLATWNSTEAARRAGYAQPRQSGAENMSNPVIADEIKARIKKRAMGADEALLRLAEQARCEYAAYLNEFGQVDLAAMKRDGKMHLIKKIKPTKFGNEVEFYDGQSALVHIGRHHQLFTDKVDLSGTVETKIDESAEQRIIGRIDSIATRLRAQSSPVGDSANGAGAESA